MADKRGDLPRPSAFASVASESLPRAVDSIRTDAYLVEDEDLAIADAIAYSVLDAFFKSVALERVDPELLPVLHTISPAASGLSESDQASDEPPAVASKSVDSSSVVQISRPSDSLEVQASSSWIQISLDSSSPMQISPDSSSPMQISPRLDSSSPMQISPQTSPVQDSSISSSRTSPVVEDLSVRSFTSQSSDVRLQYSQRRRNVQMPNFSAEIPPAASGLSESDEASDKPPAVASESVNTSLVVQISRPSDSLEVQASSSRIQISPDSSSPMQISPDSSSPMQISPQTSPVQASSISSSRTSPVVEDLSVRTFTAQSSDVQLQYSQRRRDVQRHNLPAQRRNVQMPNFSAEALRLHYHDPWMFFGTQRPAYWAPWPAYVAERPAYMAPLSPTYVAPPPPAYAPPPPPTYVDPRPRYLLARPVNMARHSGYVAKPAFGFPKVGPLVGVHSDFVFPSGVDPAELGYAVNPVRYSYSLRFWRPDVPVLPPRLLPDPVRRGGRVYRGPRGELTYGDLFDCWEVAGGG